MVSESLKGFTTQTQNSPHKHYLVGNKEGTRLHCTCGYSKSSKSNTL